MKFIIAITGTLDDAALVRNSAVRRGLDVVQARSLATCLEYLTHEPDCEGITIDETSVEVQTPKA